MESVVPAWAAGDAASPPPAWSDTERSDRRSAAVALRPPRCWGPAHLVTFNLPIPVRVLWQDVVRLYFGTIMSLRGTARIREDP